jgi:hypothetical protein
MKSLITRFASIGAIFSLVLVGLTPAAAVAALNSVRIHKGAEVSIFNPGQNSALLKVTANCSTGLNATVTVNIEQTAMESSNGTATTGTGTSPVQCNGKDQTVAVTVVSPTPGPNLGTATAEVTFTRTGDTQIMISDKKIDLLFPVLEHMEEEEGGNPEE